MEESIFDGLPPPSNSLKRNHPLEDAPKEEEVREEVKTAPALKPALKSAMKKPKLTNSDNSTPVSDAPPESGKKLTFKTTTDASTKQVIEAMQKITSHISNATKFPKASKLAIELIKAGSVKAETSEHFFAILDGAMSSKASCNDASMRHHYHALFSSASEVIEFFNKKQKHKLEVWSIQAVIGNDFYTDDSFVFSKAAGKIKEIISSLPMATEEEDMEEAMSLKEGDSDPFGLDGLISSKKRNPKLEGEEEALEFLKGKRNALIICIEIAAKRYRVPWCQTIIDILVKHAHDNLGRFTTKQREAIGKVWSSVRDQLVRRKQGKSVDGKLDVTAFEWLQEKYSTEKISIRHSVGGAGDRRAEQWLG